LSCGQQEQITHWVPTDLIDLDLELHCLFNLKRPCVDKADHIVLIPDRNMLSIWAPADVDVLPAGVDLMNTLCGW
jgi:hypothetical protein